MPKKSHKQPVNYDIVEVNEYPEEEESQEELPKPSRTRQTQKKQVKKSKKRYQSESEEDDSEEESENESEDNQAEREPQRKGGYKQIPQKKLPKGKVEVPVKTKIMSEARLRALAKGREIAKQKRLEKKNKDLEELKQKLWSEFEGKGKQPVEDDSIKQKAYKNNQMSFERNAVHERNAIQESIDEVKKLMPKPRSSIYGEPIFVDFMNRKR
jgi:hypothetical protein